ncbi:MAG TPA: Ig-like domain-containing protein [Kiritimatiellia bacterium]|nr:Ig-like domain-containing protein [Kiritimatiellia bacterium]
MSNAPMNIHITASRHSCRSMAWPLLAAWLAAVAAYAQPSLTLQFSSPATNSAPGATFNGSVDFAPPFATITSSVLSGSDIVPPANVSITPVDSNTVQVTLQPLTNKSGSVTVELMAVASGQTSTVPFTVVFRPYPPFIPVIGTRTIPEDGSTNIAFTVIDGDTPQGDLFLSASSSNTGLIDAGGYAFTGTPGNFSILITPNANINGTSTMTIAVSDGIFTNTRSFDVVVTAQPDVSTISGIGNRAFDDKVGTTNVFSGINVDDVDHNMPLPENLVATVSLNSDQFALLSSGGTTFGRTGFPATVTTSLANLGVLPLPYRGQPGAVNNVSATVRVRGQADNLTVTSIVNFAITVINTPPTFGVTVNPTSVVEGASVQPFSMLFLSDLDIADESFVFTVDVLNSNQSNLISFQPVNTLADNAPGIIANLPNLSVVASAGIVTNPFEVIPLRFTVTDSYGGTSIETGEITLVQAKNPPQINGIPVQTVNKSDADPAFLLFPTGFVVDPDEGGNQNVRAVITQSNPQLGTISTTNITFATPAQLSQAIRNLLFTPTPGVLPVGQFAETVITLTVFDTANQFAQNSSLKIRINSVNKPPQILNVLPSADQPLLLNPAAILKPFAGIGLSSDDTNNVLFTVSIDNVAKGTITNLGGFTQSSPGVFQMSGQTAAIVASLTNISYMLNPSFLFPVDDPGGTTFTLTARDFALLTSTRTLYIQVQSEPRNHLVVRAQADGLPGSLNYVLANLSNNDIVTFALPSYPATIRLPGSAATVINRNVTLKGPGANLLTISGDGNGDLVPDRQLFRIRSRVTFEGVTFSRGTASFGGAFLVESNGFLILNQCAVVDSVAAQYGGAIDVDGGQLTLDGCFIGRNRVAAETGMSGAGVSVYSDKEITIVNTTFADNEQLNPSGDGGSALVIQNLTPSTPMSAFVTHATFVGNDDASDRASAALSVDFGTRIRARNSVFNDQSGRNIDVSGAGEFISLGGNVCDDSTLTANLQQGQGGDVFLLNHPTDVTDADGLLAPLNLAGDPTPFAEPLPGSPVVGIGQPAGISVDQRGVLRQGLPDAGAIEYNAFGRLVINELQTDSNTVDFIELFVRRDSSPVDLGPYALFVDGVKVHDFAQGTIVGTNSLFSFGASASTIINPGFGMVVAFTTGPISLTSPINPTPVVGPSIPAAASGLDSRGVVSIGLSGAQPIASRSYLGIYLSPVTGTNLLATAGNSLTLAPQYRGYALVPHSYALPGPFDGANTTLDLSLNPTSPGAGSDGTPFGQDNAEPLAAADVFTVSEDNISELDVVANDYDGDGNDRLVIVDVSTTSATGTGDADSALSAFGADVAVDPATNPLRGRRLVYDPRNAATLQALPVGVEAIDLLFYEVIDIGYAAVESFADGGAGTTLITSANHRLTNNAIVTLSGSSTVDYQGTFAVTVTGEDAFTIPVAFAGSPFLNGQWESAEPRSPTARSEAAVTIRGTGINDPPVATPDTVTNVTERSLARLMVRPELAGSTLGFPGDPLPAPVNLLNQEILSNDDDVDTDDDWTSLRVVGVFGALNPITSYSGTPGQSPVIVVAPAHGLVSGDTMLIANYGGHPSYNGYHTVTVIDANTLSIPVFFVDNAADKGVWVVLDDTVRYDAVTDVGAEVTLVLRANPQEDHLLYDARTSTFLQGLALGEFHTNRFYYAVEDTHGAVGIGSIDVVVAGVNNTPVPVADPGSLGQLLPVAATNGLASVLDGGLDLMYTLPPTTVSNRVDLHVLDASAVLPGTVVLADLFSTDEDTTLLIATADLLINDSDVDRTDVLSVIAAQSVSRLGASVSLNAGLLTYVPSVSTSLQALVRDELVIDSFDVVVSDGFPGGTVTSLVAVLVTGRNDTPVANPVFHTTDEDTVFVFDPRTNDVDKDINFSEPDDRISIIPVVNVANPGLALVSMNTTQVVHDAPASQLLNQLADWQSFTNRFSYMITDNSFLFAVDDEFHVPAGSVGLVLDPLSNDRDFTDATGTPVIVSAGPSWQGGAVSIVSNGLALTYSSPPGFVGDDYLRYTIRNSAGDTDDGRIMIRSTVASINGILEAAPDAFAVAAGESVTLNVLANDNMLPASGASFTIEALVSSSQPGQPVLTNNTFRFEATNGLAPLTFRYRINGGGTSTAEADVTVAVIERRGTLRVQDDAFSVPASSFDNELDVLANEGLVTEVVTNLRIAAILVPTTHGTVTTNAAATRLLYTPAAGFVGVDSVEYLVTDRIGGTGTGRASIAVGRIDTMSDFYRIAASTSATPFVLNVLANDRVQPLMPTSLVLLAVTPNSPSTIGTMAVHPSGSHLVFTPSNVIGQVVYTYVVRDGGASFRSTTGRVTVATVPSGIYASPDRFAVRGGGASYQLPVLTNDVTYPNINKTYTLLSIGTGPNAPNQGGTVVINGNQLSYTPAPGFFGEESFTYTMTDATLTDVAQVTVSVRRGDLSANDDTYAVFYEIPSGTNTARAFTLPVVLNDRIEPAFDQIMSVVALGAGTNVPNQGGSVSISGDGLSLVYRPLNAPVGSYIEQFTYEISDGTDRRAQGTVRVRVENRASNLVAFTQDDAYAVARNSINNALPVRANDFILPGTAAGWLITSVSAPVNGGTAVIQGGIIRYSPPTGLVGEDRFSYSVNDGLGGTGSAEVRVKVGALPTLPDHAVVLSGTTSNRIEVARNDVLTPAYNGEYVLASVFGTSGGGSIAVVGTTEVSYTPAPAYAGPYPYVETFRYRMVDDTGGLVTGLVSVTVHDANSDNATNLITLLVLGVNDIPEIDNPAIPRAITDKESVSPLTSVLFTEVDEQTVERVDVTVALDDAAKGFLRNLGDFQLVAPGLYALTNVTAASASAQIGNLVFEPVENRITVPTSEDTRLIISISDNKSAPVVDTNTLITVTAVNDPPVIEGTRLNQTLYDRGQINLFSSVTITEVDDLALQPLVITITLSNRVNGVLTNVGPFAVVTTGVYRASNLTASAATEALRDLRFALGTNRVPVGGSLVTFFELVADDAFTVPPVKDPNTSVIAYNAFEGSLRPTDTGLQGSYGLAVDTIIDESVVGALNATNAGPNSGAVLVYRRQAGPTNTWTQFQVLQPLTVETNDRFGRSVAIEGDLLAAGAINDETGTVEVGSAYLFGRDLGGSNLWGEITRIFPAGITNAIRFGFSVDLSGDLLAVGAIDAAATGTNRTGGVFLYERDAGGSNAWGEIARFFPSGVGITNADFGWSVTLSGDRLAVGAPRVDVNPATTNREGAVFVYARHQGGTNAWGLVQRLAAVQTNLSFEFGWDVAMDDDLLIVGAPSMTAGTTTNGGVVHVYEYDATTNLWREIRRLDRRNDNERRFGSGVDIKNGYLLIGAPHNNGAQNIGAAYYYQRDALVATNWNLLEKLFRPAGSTAGLYGSAVGLDVDTGIVGAPSNLADISNRGFAFMYRFKYNNAPILALPVGDLFANLGIPFTYLVPVATFVDPDPDDVLAVSTAFPDGSNGFAFVEGAVTGTPETVAITPVALTAADLSGASTVHVFRVITLGPTNALATPRTVWDLANFGTDVTNATLEATVWGGGADPDGDGLTNDEEYAFGSDPNTIDTSILTVMQAGGLAQVSYVRRSNDPALTFILQGSQNLVTWTPAQWQVVSETPLGLTPDTERITLTLQVVGGNVFQHYRVLVSQ